MTPEARLDAFDTWHQDPRNRVCHDLGLPLISLAVLGALAHVPGDPAIPLLGLTLILDLVLWPAQALGVLGMGVLLWAVGRELPPWALGLAFAAGWVLQLAGHRAIERNAPAFTTNLLHLVLGPRWLVRRWGRLLRGVAP